jgi:hypothetical protein
MSDERLLGSALEPSRVAGYGLFDPYLEQNWMTVLVYRESESEKEA